MECKMLKKQLRKVEKDCSGSGFMLLHTSILLFLFFLIRYLMR